MTATIQLTEDQKRQIVDILRNPPAVRHLTFRALQERTGVSRRNLRYVLDHALIPKGMFRAIDRPASGRGVARELSPFSGFVVTLAALMLDSGLRGPLVQRAMKALMEWAVSTISWTVGPAIGAFLLYTWAPGLIVEIADGASIRVNVTAKDLPESRTGCPRGLPWTDIKMEQSRPNGYAPLVSVRLYLGELKSNLG